MGTSPNSRKKKKNQPHNQLLLQVTSVHKVQLTPVYCAAGTTIRGAGTLWDLPATLGRRQLAEAWWKDCPHQCQAAHPASKPCREYCWNLRRRRHLQALSQRMVHLEAGGRITVLGKHPELIQMEGSFRDFGRCDLKIGLPSNPPDSPLEQGSSTPQRPWMRFSLQLLRAVTPESRPPDDEGSADEDTPYAPPAKRRMVFETSSSSSSATPPHVAEKRFSPPVRGRQLFPALASVPIPPREIPLLDPEIRRSSPQEERLEKDRGLVSTSTDRVPIEHQAVKRGPEDFNQDIEEKTKGNLPSCDATGEAVSRSAPPVTQPPPLPDPMRATTLPTPTSEDSLFQSTQEASYCQRIRAMAATEQGSMAAATASAKQGLNPMDPPTRESSDDRSSSSFSASFVNMPAVQSNDDHSTVRIEAAQLNNLRLPHQPVLSSIPADDDDDRKMTTQTTTSKEHGSIRADAMTRADWQQIQAASPPVSFRHALAALILAKNPPGIDTASAWIPSLVREATLRQSVVITPRRSRTPTSLGS